MRILPELLRRKGFWLAAYLGWFCALFVISALPGSSVGFQPFRFFDKLEHAGFFFVGSVILIVWLTLRGDWPARWWWVLLAAAAVGGFDEWHQKFSPGRSALNLADWLADIAGGVLALIAAWAFAARRMPSGERGDIAGR